MAKLRYPYDRASGLDANATLPPPAVVHAALRDKDKSEKNGEINRGAKQVPRPDEGERRVRAIKALDLEKQGQYRAALDLLEELRDDDFTIPRHREIKGELDDGRFEVEYVGPFHTGNRRLAMMRCHLQLGHPREAVALAWQTLEAGTADASAFACIAEHAELQGGFDSVEGRLRDLLKKDPKHAAAAQCCEYVRVQRELAAGKYAALVERIRSGAWDRASERGPKAELKEYVSNTLAKRTNEALPELVKVLAQYDQSTWIVYCLGRSGDQRAIEPLLKYLQSVRNYYARQETLRALFHLGPPRDLAVLTKTLQPLLAGEDHSDRHDALILIRDHWGRPELATLVISALDKMFQRPAANWDQAASRTVACQILGKYADERAVPVLLKAMEDPFEQHFFDHNGPRGHVGHSYHTIWWEADAALRKITHASPSEAPATHRSPKPGQREKTLADWKAWVAARPAGKPLSQVKPPTDAEIDQAIKQLAGADRNARHKAAERLGEAGPAANRAIPALIAALKEEARRPKADSEMAATTEEGYAGCLIRVLAGFGKPAVASLIEVLKKDADLRLHLLDVLERIGADAEAAVPVVVSLGKDADDETRASAIGTLGKIGRRSPQAIAAVSDGLRDGFQPVRAKAVRALGECGPAAKEAVPALIRAWKEEKDESVRQGILDALGLIGPGAKDAVPMLTEALRHNEPIIRWCAARALGRIGPSAATATAALTEATSYKADYVRKQAAESLERISRTKASGGRAGAPPSAPAPPSPPQGLPSDMLQKDLLQHKMIEPGVKEFFERARHKFAQTPSRVAISPDTLKKPGAMGSGWKFDHDSEEGGHGRFLQFLGQGAMLKLSGGDELMVHLRTFPSAAQAREWALNRAFSGAAPTDSMLQRANRYFGKPEYPGDFCFGPWLFNRANVVVEYGSAMTDEAALRVSREVDKQILGLTPELTPRPAAEK